ncbi:polyunsaturated fatty acid lipoxygenase ALOX8 [Gambusia affinis]|uniref:polyunsaturated fatty acid lipoxygenase ALOX8 n=1 Tax=Gambusia affinis TaxID=33528 RepID=UPI001CDD44FD|nr:polyunsaturated fatty acid lipoxygenase ALOX8 [Gambusia affinis]
MTLKVMCRRQCGRSLKTAERTCSCRCQTPLQQTQKRGEELLNCRMGFCQEFEVTVHTSPGPTCGTYNRLRLSLIGSQGETPPITVNDDHHLLPGSTCLVLVRPSGPLGRVVLVRLQLEVQTGFPNLDWHCNRVELRQRAKGQEPRPDGSETQVFLCDKWLRTADGDVELRSGKLCLLAEETEERVKQHRLSQLQRQRQLIRWGVFIEGTPQCLDLKSLSDLGPNLSYTHISPSIDLHYLKGFAGRAEPWTSFSELETAFALSGHQNNIAKFVKAHWMEEWYFGYQSLNGCNPLLLRQTHLIPPNLAVTSDMLRPFLPADSSLEEELQRGNIYLLDYKLLDGLEGNRINGKQTYLSAPLCLLHLNELGQVVPIAIQLQQTPGPQNPVFLPSDPSCDWLLAKIWVHSADFQGHQLVSHYMRTHMMAELCCIATLRQLPEHHPLHQLLMPHIRTSLQINMQARASLLAANGPFDQAVGSGLKTIPDILRRASATIHYRSLCVPDDLLDRGVDKLPHSFYAQDAQRIWDVLYRFVLGWVQLYYGGDKDVQNDSELQNWIADINTHGFSQNAGFPPCFQTEAEVSKFVTMVIFSCSALHAAVNFSQLDFALWLPNCPAAMMRPPPQAKGAVTEQDILSFLPDINSANRVLMTLAMLSQPGVDFVPLCHYREAVFRVDAHRRLLEEVQAELQVITDDITERNRHLELPYAYLCPSGIENSVAI